MVYDCKLQEQSICKIVHCWQLFNFYFEVVANITSESYAKDTFAKINDFFTDNDPMHSGAEFELSHDAGTTHLSVVAPNGDAVAITSTINH